MTDCVKQPFRILAAAGFSILSGLCGIGLSWIVVGILATTRSRAAADKFVAESMPILFAGGLIGVIVGVVVSVIVLRMDPRREQEIEERYVGARGRMSIYFGVPVFVVVLLAPLLSMLGNVVGQNADIYVDLGVALVVIALSLVLYDHIPKRFVVLLGVISWLLTLSVAAWFFFFGAGAFGHG